MNYKYNRVGVWLRRDLRFEDNTALTNALNESKEVFLFFIIDVEIVSRRNSNSKLLRFLAESLNSLSNVEIHIGKSHEVIAEICQKRKLEAVYWNADYSPFARRRDLNVKEQLESKRVECCISSDLLLNPPGKVMNAEGLPYRVFTPFMKTSRTLDIQKPINPTTDQLSRIASQKTPNDPINLLNVQNVEIEWKGRRTEAMSILNLLSNYRGYEETRNQLWNETGTTHLSMYNKFGLLSIREVYWAIRNNLGADSMLINELYWRDFFYHLGYHFPYVTSGAFRSEFNRIKWNNDSKLFKSWCEGKTGYPIVDAGMRQLNETGYMHNRARMITASFLVKNLGIDWRWGEKYFAEKLIDYDLIVNNGNWQWVAGTGSDSQPYFRIFNPESQAKKFDPEGKYQQKWLGSEYNLDPIVDYKTSRIEAVKRYRAVAS